MENASRSVYFNKLTDKELAEVLEKEYRYLNIPQIAFEIADGNVKKAISLKNKEEEYIKVNKLFGNLESIDIIDLMESKELIFKDKQDVEDILSYINLIFFEKVRVNVRYIACMKKVENTKDRLNKNNNFDMTIDNFIMTVWEEING